ncbi:MAG TPA: isoprenylcysteine carboxylmethyltransferase family protein [Verrucomicrobiae bacterium]|jgi:protein-S-isoprenylcysteine O-methyltransferase Ste14|nr:isoprenylcysteine carboxylmethyltransferase family protein [Verrucomicrobiae bacterium]
MNDRQHVVFTALQIFAVGLVLWYIFTWKSTPWNAQRDIGTALVMIGAVGIATARYQLGRSFSVTAQARHLVTRGLYSRIRNPIYVFGTILITGVILVLNMPVLWVGLAALVCIQVIRARREARVLEAAFGDEYREYRRKTWL